MVLKPFWIFYVIMHSQYNCNIVHIVNVCVSKQQCFKFRLKHCCLETQKSSACVYLVLYTIVPRALLGQRLIVCEVECVIKVSIALQVDVTPDAKTCPTQFEVTNSNQSCYLYQVTTSAFSQAQLQQSCKALQPESHLVAVNTQQEHDAVKAFFTAADPVCGLIWTAGRTDNPAGLTDWYWDLRTCTTQKVTYFNWKSGEPNNKNNIENTIMMEFTSSFKMMDVPEDVSASGWFSSQTMCYVCEIDLPHG